jgi:hypothetical protein
MHERVVEEPSAFQPGQCQEGRTKFPGLNPADTRVDVSANGLNHKISPARKKLAFSPQAAGGDSAFVREFIN